MKAKSNTHSYKRYSNRYWRRCISRVMVFTFIVMLIMSMAFTCKMHDNELEGKIARVEWSTLNLREKAGADKPIIGTLNEGNIVILTGDHKDASMGGDYSDHWYEVEVNGETGWVYAPGINF